MRFSNSHEWAEKFDENTLIIGITNYGKMHLGQIINIKLPDLKKVNANEEVCIVESDKAAVDVHSPISGEIIDVNKELNQSLDKLNTSPEKEGWIFKIKVQNFDEFEKLLSLEDYEKKVSKS
ncbi:MAG: Glycine cleavage system H protein [Candidatus Anoxychlamydiales bacterium]|nr:Glycine cleavage system H protein [Candidatus Anoxychlamydiales bacterium]